MKRAIIKGIMGTCIILTGCGHKQESSDKPASPLIAAQPGNRLGDLPDATVRQGSIKELAAQSSVIVYANCDGNDHLVVTEIWKGSDVASAIAVIIGTQIPYHTPPKPLPQPDGAIVFLPQGCSSATQFSGMSVTAIPTGGQEIKTQFKKSFGL